MTSPLVAVRELQVPYKGDVFRVEVGAPRKAAPLVYLLRDDGNVVHGRALAFALRENGFGTAICHLLTDAERERAARHRQVPVCVALLAGRLMAVVDAVGDDAEPGEASAGIVVSGVAAAAALRVAVLRPLAFDAIVCRHPRIESLHSIEYVTAATLFLAVAGDLARIRPMTRAFRQLQCARHFEIVSGDSPAFDDARSFHLATELTTAWLRRHVGHAATAVEPPKTDVQAALPSPAEPLRHPFGRPA